MEVNSRNLVDGRISVSFNNYVVVREQNVEIEHELLAVLKEKVIINYEDDPTQYPEASNQECFLYILVHKLTGTAMMMKNKTSGVAGFDLAADQSIIIEPKGRVLVPTGLSLEILWGTYGRIAARSSIAWKLGLDIGPDGKFDYYVNYDIPKLFQIWKYPPPPSWDDEVVEESKPNLDVQLPKEKHALSTFLEEEALSPKEASKDLAGTTSPWASVPQSKDPFDDIPEEDCDFSYIQYLAKLSPPNDVIWDSYEDIEEFRIYSYPFLQEVMINGKAGRQIFLSQEEWWVEVDLTRGSQIVYIIPDIMMTINDFYKNIQLSILTRGYDQWQGGEANLLITRGMMGRLSNTPNTGFAYEIQGVVDYLTSHGVRVNSRNLVDGRISVSFTNYTAAREQNDEIEHELLAVLKEKAIINYEDDPTQYPEASNQESFPYILVHKLTGTAVMMKNKTSGAAGFDFATDQSIIIEPRGRALVPTELTLEIPWGTYGRIASRSNIAWKLGLDIRAGVIDSDYRVEIFILLFNHSDERVFIPRGMAIAQIIFGQIIHPNIYEVTQLSTTNRGTGGFGSTDTQSSTGSNSKKSKSKSKAKYATERWDTLGQPSGKFDYYVNYDIPKALPDLELPPPSWDDEVVEESKPNLDLQLPKEKHQQAMKWNTRYCGT
ncbi:hypothetical protein ZIOFF_005942 [Zingiber officinale]|uniref:dUTP diphosphatase n=1 Tax=Zingiber officinale TaxID=94328 RepID=A0A8J5HWS1_ZINOF|nr:hypothetical protein ZIOFF_005942 [Zingiber officinale]